MKIVHIVVFLLCAIFNLLASSNACGQEAAFPFKDVPKGHWARVAIEKCVAARVFDKDQNFNGNDNVSRFDVAQTVDRVLQIINRQKKSSHKARKFTQNLEINYGYGAELSLLRTRIEILEEKLAAIKEDSRQRKR